MSEQERHWRWYHTMVYPPQVYKTGSGETFVVQDLVAAAIACNNLNALEAEVAQLRSRLADAEAQLILERVGYVEGTPEYEAALATLEQADRYKALAQELYEVLRSYLYVVKRSPLYRVEGYDAADVSSYAIEAEEVLAHFEEVTKESQ